MTDCGLGLHSLSRNHSLAVKLLHKCGKRTIAVALGRKQKWEELQKTLILCWRKTPRMARSELASVIAEFLEVSLNFVCLYGRSRCPR